MVQKNMVLKTSYRIHGTGYMVHMSLFTIHGTGCMVKMTSHRRHGTDDNVHKILYRKRHTDDMFYANIKTSGDIQQRYSYGRSAKQGDMAKKT